MIKKKKTQKAKVHNLRETYFNKDLIAILFFVVICGVCLILISNNKKTLIINEVCSHNVTIVHDEEGNYCDYIELYNNGDEIIELENFYLSDNHNNLKKYNLSSFTIDPKEYLVIFVNKAKNEFSISDNEIIYLTDSRGKIYDSVCIPKTNDDESYCYFQEENKWFICKPTPNRENIKINKELTKPSASVESGFYDSSFLLELESENDIFYTLDGTEPSIESNKYAEPILIYDNSNQKSIYGKTEEISTLDNAYFNDDSITKGTVLRAIAVDNNGYISEELCETYFINYKDKDGYNELPTMSLITNPDNLFGYENGIYVKGFEYDLNKQKNADVEDEGFQITNYSMTGKNWKRYATIQFYGANTKIQYENNVKISIKGSYSRNFSQKSFNIYNINDENGIFEIFNRQLNSLTLKGVGSSDNQSTTSARIRNDMIQLLTKDCNVFTQEGIYTQLFIDGEYWGVYNLQERNEINSISEKYGIEENNIVIIKGDDSSSDNEIISNNAYQENEYFELLEFMKNNDLSLKKNYEYVCSKIDIESFIDYYAIELYLNNIDWPNNNYAVWKTLSNDENCNFADSKWRYILYDMDDCAGYDELNSYIVNPFMKDNGEPKYYNYFYQLMENTEFRELFKDRFNYIIEEIFDAQKVKQTVKENFYKYKASMIESQKRFYDENYNEEDFMWEINGFIGYFEDRPLYAKQYLEELLDYYDNK